MNNDVVINQLAKITGTLRKQVIDALKKLQNMSEVLRELERGRRKHDKRR